MRGMFPKGFDSVKYKDEDGELVRFDKNFDKNGLKCLFSIIFLIAIDI